jgi:hypothetical protein
MYVYYTHYAILPPNTNSIYNLSVVSYPLEDIFAWNKKKGGATFIHSYLLLVACSSTVVVVANSSSSLARVLLAIDHHLDLHTGTFIASLTTNTQHKHNHPNTHHPFLPNSFHHAAATNPHSQTKIWT